MTLFGGKLAPCKIIQESLGFWIPALDSGFEVLESVSVDLGFQFPQAKISRILEYGLT